MYLVRCGELVNVVAHYDDDAWTEEPWIREVDCSEVIENYRGWHESLMRPFSATEKRYKWALYDRVPLEQWRKGRATILGDAAHPMLPYLGRGACQAMEDGVVLAPSVAAMPDGPLGALKLYERARLPRASQVVLTARERGEDDHLVSPLAALKRDALIAIRRRFGKDPTGRGTTWIFEYDAGSPHLLEAA